MKSIVVVDESPSVRETLTIVLGREHLVRAAATIEEMPATESAALVILGLPPAARETAVVDAALATVDGRVPFLLLNRPGARADDRLRRAGRSFSVVAKPFELHALRAAVTRALAEPAIPAAAVSEDDPAGRWLDHPYLSREAALVAARALGTELPVLLIGTPGTGAPDVARTLHAGRMKPGQFIARSARGLDERAVGRAARRARRGTLFIDDVDLASCEAQHALLALLRAHDDRSGGDAPDVVAASATSLDARVAAGEVVPELAHALAGVVLRLTPLCERAIDVPQLIDAETTRLARRLGLAAVSYTEAARTRLTQYLWPGNVAELTAVVMRTLAIRRPGAIDASDLLFDGRDIVRDGEVARDGNAAIRTPFEHRAVRTTAAETARLPRIAAPPTVSPASDRRARTLHAIPVTPVRTLEPDVTPSAPGAELPSLEVLVGELAHELRNPMVTIKTFAQHLDSVLADPEVRARFSTLAGEAITRMDALLENLLDFARFRAPQRQPTDLRALMDRALAECADELGRKDVRVEHGHDGTGRVDADEAQLLFAFRSLLGGLLPDLLPHEPLRVSGLEPAQLVLSAHTERTVSQRLARLVGDEHDGDEPQGLPLAFALAAALIRRNGGVLRTAVAADGRTAITVDWSRTTREGV